MKKYILFILILVFQFEGQSFAQHNKGGLPQSFNSEELSRTFHEVYLSSPDLDKIGKEDEASNDNRFAVLQSVDFGTSNSGTWEWLKDGSRIWRLKITYESSLAISLYFKDFYLPEGAKLFLYDENKNQVKGAFSNINNKRNGLFTAEMILGEKAVVELYIPTGIQGDSFFTISEVSYAYRFVRDINGYNSNSKSGFCEVNTNCSPEGDDWQNEKLGVVRIKVKISGALFWCSGSLVNNIREDKSPYILTADHCAFKFNHYATPTDLSQWIFDFNYEGLTCGSTSPSSSNFTLIGAEKIAHSGTHGNSCSDFYLIKLFDSIPNNANVVFNGWSAEGEGSYYGTCIHHPSGDIKKISTYNEQLTTTNWQGNGIQSHWEVFWAETINGWGVTEGGSSGSPIFDEYGRIIGTLTGGLASCTNTEDPDYYGKFSYHWDSNGTNDTLQLKPWLDPDDTGAITMGGTIGDTVPNEMPPKTDVDIEPNPVFEDVLKLKFVNTTASKADITITDLTGQIILKKQATINGDIYTLDISPLPEGFYITIIRLDEIYIEKKFIKQ